jgi:hypothetical protein
MPRCGSEHGQHMSWVCNVLVSVDIQDRAALDEFNDWLAGQAPRSEGLAGSGVGQLGDLVGDSAPAWKGPKYPECRLWGGALNHADVDAVVARFGALRWRVPGAAQLFTMDQEQTYFRLWMIRDGRVQQYAPEPPIDDTAW